MNQHIINKTNIISLKDSIYQSINESTVNENLIKDINTFIDNSDYLSKIKEISSNIIKKFGKNILLKILNVYYVITEKNVPIKEKLAAISCIIYIISPIDALNDLLPIGYTDDIALLTYVISFLEKYITNNIIEKSENTIKKWNS